MDCVVPSMLGEKPGKYEGWGTAQGLRGCGVRDMP